MHRARAYKGSKLGPEKQARQNPKVGLGTGPDVRPYRNRSKSNTGGKCSICSDSYGSGIPCHVVTCTSAASTGGVERQNSVFIYELNLVNNFFLL